MQVYVVRAPMAPVNGPFWPRSYKFVQYFSLITRTSGTGDVEGRYRLCP
jgi:hypothetical protein